MIHNHQQLQQTVQQLAQHGKGILAADESNRTATKRLNAINVESTPENRRRYRSLLFSTPSLGQFISGTILYEETLYQHDDEGTPLPQVLINQGIVPGIKVDQGLVPLINSQEEKTTQGLDGLADKLKQYHNTGARFTKWRCVYQVDSHRPSYLAVSTNAEVLARYAALAQDNNLVPVVEPEILIDGDHSQSQCQQASEMVWRHVFQALARHKVTLEYMILKPSMVISGKDHSPASEVDEVAEATLTSLKRTVPASVPSINFLSGGQTPEQATAHLNSMNQYGPLPWNLSFSYARALQDPCLQAWQGLEANRQQAQTALYHRAWLNSLAAQGHYHEQYEQTSAQTTS